MDDDDELEDELEDADVSMAMGTAGPVPLVIRSTSDWVNATDGEVDAEVAAMMKTLA